MSTLKSLKRTIINDFKISGKPAGWVVRELYDPKTRRSKVFEFGIYVTNKIFLSIPMHYSFKSKLEKYPTTTVDEYTYYLIPGDMEFALGKFTTKKGAERPVLLPVDDKHPAMLITALAVQPEVYGDKIIDLEVSEGQIVVRDFIDKERDMIAVITATETDKTEITVHTGAIGSTVLNTIKNVSENGTNSTTFDTNNVDDVIKTKFISLNRYINRVKENKSNNE